MLSLDLGTISEYGEFEPSEGCLRAVKHYPPAHGNEGIISPVFAGLIALNPNMCNVQFATGYTLSRYLAKYIVAIDLYNTIRISPPKPHNEENTFEVHGQELPNQKITGNRIQEAKRKRGTKGQCEDCKSQGGSSIQRCRILHDALRVQPDHDQHRLPQYKFQAIRPTRRPR